MQYIILFIGLNINKTDLMTHSRPDARRRIQDLTHALFIYTTTGRPVWVLGHSVTHPEIRLGQRNATQKKFVSKSLLFHVATGRTI